ncbi:PAS domain S-box protein [Desulforhabdus amnigena]|uniref:histidine kinase n=1 Tax=Desulforhabdus amnigena TaxID=40218 RepID=A0A9W6FTD5_9BACT|nr:PAS domain S-box protein [Desulforhabdus amnigena]NLJ28966.1 PAS domain S-box protein [Deltaproteobacteria bacterium]GLI33620.1 hypothetical protein DAMNIGENAA_10530 [Desulforhabdus amnigena]
MISNCIKVLLIEDNPGDARLIKELFLECAPGSFDLKYVETLYEGIEILETQEIDTILLDLSLPDSHGFETFLKVHDRTPEIPIIILTGFDDETLAIKAVKEGAQDYLVKGHVSSHLLARATRYAIERKRTEEALRRARNELEVRVQERTAEFEKANEELRCEIAERQKAEEALRTSQQMLQLVMDNIPQSIFWKDKNLIYQGCNHNFAVDAGLRSPEEIVGKTDYDMVWQKEQADFFRKTDLRVMREDAPQLHIIEPQLQANGKLAWLETNKIPLHDSEGNVMGILGTYEDFTERRYLEELLAWERKILEMIATGSALQETLDTLTAMTEELATGSYSSILLLDAEREKLFHASAPSLPAQYIQSIDGFTIGPSAGSCGTAAYFSKTVVVEDTATDPLWANYRDLAMKYGLRSCFSVPIRASNGTVLGTFALYDGLQREPSQKDLQLVEVAAHLAGIAIERRQAEEAIRANEEKYRSLFEESRDAIAVVTRDGKFLDINQAGLDLFGYTRSELMTTNISELYIRQRDRDTYQKKIEKEGSVRDYRVKFRKKNGQEMDCLLTSTLKYSKDGSILGYQGIFRDITAYKKAEEALRESEARYRAIVEDQTELIFRSLPDQTITFVNNAFCRYFERKQEELIGAGFLPFLVDEDHKKVREHFASLNPKNPVGTIELRAMKPGGGIRWQQWTNRLILNGQNHPKEFQSVGRDITEQKQMEEALQRSAEKIKLFAYSVSHDLKSPAVGVYGLTNLLYKQYGNTLDARGKTYCEQILKASEQIAALVEKINLYISTKEVSLIIERVNLRHVLQMIKDEFSTRFSIRSIRWTIPDDLPEVKADRLALLRVLRNLVDNALKYGGDDLSEIAVGYEESPHHHIISVRDDGIGIRREDTQKIFDLFQRKEEVREIEGSGLGLAIVKEIAEQHGGKVWATPAPGKGSIFYISISKKI